MKRSFVLTPQARDDLQEILLVVAAHSPGVAERLRLEFHRGPQHLGRSPGIGHYREELLDRRYRFWTFYSYVVVYAWKYKPIRVIAVIHSRRDLDAFFRADDPRG